MWGKYFHVKVELVVGFSNILACMSALVLTSFQCCAVGGGHLHHELWRKSRSLIVKKGKGYC